VREATGDKADRVVAVAQLALGPDAEPLRPGDRDEILRKSGARDLLATFDGKSCRAAGTRRLARDDEIIGKPSGIASLPVDAGYAAEIDAESVRSAEKIEKKSGGDGVLIAKATSARGLNGRFFLDVALHLDVPMLPVSGDMKSHAAALLQVADNAEQIAAPQVAARAEHADETPRRRAGRLAKLLETDSHVHVIAQNGLASAQVAAQHRVDVVARNGDAGLERCLGLPTSRSAECRRDGGRGRTRTGTPVSQKQILSRPRPIYASHCADTSLISSPQNHNENGRKLLTEADIR
jgi:hypothetical protein